jgi:hypothetical protein
MNRITRFNTHTNIGISVELVDNNQIYVRDFRLPMLCIKGLRYSRMVRGVGC